MVEDREARRRANVLLMQQMNKVACWWHRRHASAS